MRLSSDAGYQFDPHQTMTVRLEDLGDWDDKVQPPLGFWKVSDVFKRMKDYCPKNLKIHAITVYTPRALTGGPVFNTGSIQQFLVLTDLSVSWVGNWIGHTSAATNAYDVIQVTTIPVTLSGRTKQTFYPSNGMKGLFGTIPPSRPCPPRQI